MSCFFFFFVFWNAKILLQLYGTSYSILNGCARWCFTRLLWEACQRPSPLLWASSLCGSISFELTSSFMLPCVPPDPWSCPGSLCDSSTLGWVLSYQEAGVLSFSSANHSPRHPSCVPPNKCLLSESRKCSSTIPNGVMTWGCLGKTDSLLSTIML